jgi:hypothetical protein
MDELPNDIDYWLDIADKVSGPVSVFISAVAIALTLTVFVYERRRAQRRPVPAAPHRGRRRLATAGPLVVRATLAGIGCLAAMLFLVNIIGQAGGGPPDRHSDPRLEPTFRTSEPSTPKSPPSATTEPIIVYPREGYVALHEAVEVIAPHDPGEEVLVMVRYLGAEWNFTRCSDSTEGTNACPGVRFGKIQAHKGPWQLVAAVVTATEFRRLTTSGFTYTGSPESLNPIRASRIYTYNRRTA